MFCEATVTGSSPEALLFVLFVSITCRHSRRGERERNRLYLFFSSLRLPRLSLSDLSLYLGPRRGEVGGFRGWLLLEGIWFHWRLMLCLARSLKCT